MSLEVKNIQVSFDGRTILDQLSFSLAKGEIGCLLGHSGCGKTTALRVIAGFEEPQSGEVWLNGQVLFSKTQQRPAHQRGIGMVFQDYALFPHLRVAENIAFGLHQYSNSDKQKRVAELLELTGLQNYERHYPHQLSGGQQQRVALARALAPKPELILFDEPFSNLDADLRLRLSQDVRQLLKYTETSAILVTHDQHEAFAMADQIGVMAEGRLQQWGSAADLYYRPQTAHIAAFIGQGSFIEGIIENGQIQTVLGWIPNKQAQSCPEHSRVQLLIRPEDVLLDEHGQCEAQIIRKDFQGGRWLYTLNLPNNETILAQWQEEYSIHTKVRLSWKGKVAHFFSK